MTPQFLLLFPIQLTKRDIFSFRCLLYQGETDYYEHTTKKISGHNKVRMRVIKSRYNCRAIYSLEVPL